MTTFVAARSDSDVDDCAPITELHRLQPVQAEAWGFGSV